VIDINPLSEPNPVHFQKPPFILAESDIVHLQKTPFSGQMLHCLSNGLNPALDIPLNPCNNKHTNARESANTYQRATIWHKTSIPLLIRTFPNLLAQLT